MLPKLSQHRQERNEQGMELRVQLNYKPAQCRENILPGISCQRRFLLVRDKVKR